MNRETELTKKIEEAGWEIIGVGFKENNSDAMKVTDAQKINDVAMNEIIPWFSWALFECASDRQMYWVCQKEV
ncbi:hypothetical protein [Methylobacter sp.]|uniref:hypothetical protein n=1 Tax=Methylobacter sp. TaxID=2051955 RepID=UPI002FDE3C90